MHETGRFIRIEVVGAAPPAGFSLDQLNIDGLCDCWQLDSVKFRPFVITAGRCPLRSGDSSSFAS
jgi:hypothetical protein